MPETAREDFLHWQFKGSHVLFSGVSNIWLGSLVVVVICLTERFLTYAQDRQWTPSFLSRNRLSTALWSTMLYWVITLLRFCEMLAVMTFHAGLLLVIVTALAAGQFVIELKNYDRNKSQGKSGSYFRIETSENPHLMAKPRDIED
ncbi:copper transporter [Moniliophthora roreri MCA 2997]|uniref:Copper transport protein n=2 Tax=Moniliophthora roreri TaxID=221103 RepID=V2W4T8_MONRO|nr:copper transporter [Moniliophthora roreri MCA 2997]